MHDAPLRWLWYCSSIVALALAVSACGGDDREEGSTQTDTGPDVQEVVEDTSPGLDCDATPTAPGCVEPPAAALCSECNVDGDCGPSGKCIADARGTTFCSRQCGYFGDTQCPAEYYCRQFGNAATEFFCWPLNGVCEVDGKDCSPCLDTEGNTDCAAGLVCIEPLGDIRFCARPCEGDGTCPYSGMDCGHVDGLAGSLCLPKINGVATPKCGARPLEYCEPCKTAGQCKTGVCVDSPNIGQICSMPCDSDSACPSGTDCVHNNCVPPIAHGCQGFLSCFGVDCKVDEICYKGFCLAAP